MNTPSAFLFCLLSASLLPGCTSTPSGDSSHHTASPPNILTSNPDPSIRIVMAPTPNLIENPTTVEGALKTFTVRGTHNQLILSFEPRSSEPRHKDLAAYSAWADNLLKERTIRTVSLSSDNNPLTRSAIPHVLKTYVNVARAGHPSTAICDAAGLRFETPGGFWTISCNSDLGKVDQAVAAIDDATRTLDISIITPTSR